MPVGTDTTQFGTETPYHKTPPTNFGTVAEAAATGTPPTAAGVAQTDCDDAAVPVNTVVPAITGTTTTGQTLTCGTGTWSPAASSYAYQWYRVVVATGVASAIAGATASTRVLAAPDTGAQLFCRVVAKDATGRGSMPVDTVKTATIA